MSQPYRRSRTVRGSRRAKRDYSPERSCSTKVRYPNWAEAEATVRRIVDENIDAGRTERSVGLSAYRCERCGAWHIGHSRGPLQPVGRNA